MANIWKREMLKAKEIPELLNIKNSLSNPSMDATTRSFRTNLINSVLDEKGYKELPKVLDVSNTVEFDHYIANAYSAKVKNAKERNIEFNLSIGQFKTLYRRKRCYYTGIPMVNGGGLDNPLSKTLDRIDSKKGYVMGNVVCCTNKINAVKNELFENPYGSKARLVDVANLVSKLQLLEKGN